MKIVIVGLGVIGGSFAMALKEAGYQEVYGIDTNAQTLQKAREMGIIREGQTVGDRLLRDADLVILAIYPQLMVFYSKSSSAFKARVRDYGCNRN